MLFRSSIPSGKLIDIELENFHPEGKFINFAVGTTEGGGVVVLTTSLVDLKQLNKNINRNKGNIFLSISDLIYINFYK